MFRFHSAVTETCNNNDDYLQDIVRKLATNAKHLKIAHLNIRGLRNKVDEIRILLKLCRFDAFGITETHLKSEIGDGEKEIENYKFIRRDRSDRHGGGCVLYYHKSLKVIHRPDLEEDKVEGICAQVKAGSRDILIGIIYRPPNQNNDFFSVFPRLLEKAWTKFSNIVLLGDFNTNLLQDQHGEISHEGNRMRSIFEQYYMLNVIEGPTRITNHSKTLLIDLIVTTRKDLVKQKGTCPLGISDHDMIYATLSASVPRDPPKIITTRNFSKFNEGRFQSEIKCALSKFAKSLTIQLMLIMHGICFSQEYATNMRHLNRQKYAVTVCLG